MTFFQAFQLVISSEIYFPELLPIADNRKKIDVSIQFGSVPPHGLEKPLQKRRGFQVKPGEFWLDIPNIARFLVCEGRMITIDPTPGIDEDSIRLFVLGSCFGALLMQRGLFLLHGNAICMQEQAISIVGLSGAGKSTLSGVFLKRGYSILADDLCAINEQMLILPSFPQVKLWADAAKQLNIDTQSLRKVRPSMEKYAVPLETNFYQTPLPLKRIYILNSHNKDQINMQPLTAMAKFVPLRSHIYRLPFIQGLSQERQSMLRCGQIANAVKVTRITRPDMGYSMNQLADEIERDLACVD